MGSECDAEAKRTVDTLAQASGDGEPTRREHAVKCLGSLVGQRLSVDAAWDRGLPERVALASPIGDLPAGWPAGLKLII